MTSTARAPRGTNFPVRAFMEALDGIPDKSVQDVAKAALAKIKVLVKKRAAEAKVTRKAEASVGMRSAAIKPKRRARRAARRTPRFGRDTPTANALAAAEA